ncbi:MAG: VWA domain-containing protein [Anaerolineae bacterium]|nr:VWA domain-containing protein [Anaerolineae bacterium]MDW8171395.1 VWA domain-containing protein [Anaerolineae bacterium]
MSFSQPAYLTLLVLIPLGVLFFLWRNLARQQALRQMGDEALVGLLIQRISPARRRLRELLWLIALASTILALARPTWGVEAETQVMQGVEVVLAIDVSLSMDAQDVAPSRLRRALLVARDLLEALTQAHVGVLIFTRQAQPILPITYDRSAAALLLDSLNSGAISQQGTSLAAAIRRALPMFDERSGAQRFLILLTDGEDHEGDVLAAAREAQSRNVRIDAVGFGTLLGGIIPIYDAQGIVVDYKKDSSGSLVETRRDDATLSALSQTAGGTYIPYEPGTSLQPLIDAINGGQQGERMGRLVVRPIERFGFFAALAILALGLEVFLPDSRPSSSRRPNYASRS